MTSSVSEKEKAQNAKEAEGGPVSKALSVIATVAKAGSTIPEISAVAEPASWVAEILAKAARAYGWSKPNPPQQYAQVITSPMNTATSDGPDLVIPLSLTTKKAVTPLPLGGSNKDELSLDSVLTHWTNFTQVTWTTQASQSVLWSLQITPLSYSNSYTDVTTGSTAYKTSHMLSILSHYAQGWRGAFRFRFRFYKTKYHTGSVMAVFYPGNISSAPTFAQSPFAIRELLDIQKGNTLEITCPYTSQNTFSAFGDSPGMIVLYVVNPLTNPNTVTQNVAISLDVSCAPGFEVAGLMVDTNPICVYSVQSAGQQRNRTSPPRGAALVLPELRKEKQPAPGQRSILQPQ